MGLVTPELGLTFWMVVGFLTVFFILSKFAWKPILKMVKEREASIEDALKAAEKAKADVQSMQADNERILAEARNQRDIMLKEAREMKESIISEAKDKAKSEAEKLIALSREAIQNEKMAAITELKNQVAILSIDIAEKILKRELAAENKQKELIGDLLKETKLN